MSTRSLIGIQPDPTSDSILAIYCHSDGYPEWNGRILLEHFPTEEKATALVSGHDVSALGKDGGIERYADVSTPCKVPLSELDAVANDCWAEYIYVFSRGKWLVKAIARHADPAAGWPQSARLGALYSLFTPLAGLPAIAPFSLAYSTAIA
jgi:hypothetical protein